MLIIETSQQQRSTASAVESFRNEVVTANEENRKVYMNELMNNYGVIPTTITPLTNTNLLITGEEQ